ncbi:MAG: DUF433 domain-containing protein [Leptolyngbyaceae cyanobacterium]
MSDKESILALIQRLPETVSFQEILEEIQFVAAIQEGVDDLDQGQGVSIDAVEQTIEATEMASDSPTTIIQTERGLTISGTRITLYDVMDYLKAQYPPKFIQGLFNLTAEQITTALNYIEVNRQQVEAEHQQVLKIAGENQQYWEERNRERIADIEASSPRPGKEELWAKLQAQKARHAAEA